VAAIDSRWFAEDRKLPAHEQKEAIEKSKKALKRSTLLVRRLKAILDEEIEKTYTREEQYTEADWDRVIYGMFQRRKTLKEIIKLLP
jgi:hypothetical protein